MHDSALSRVSILADLVFHKLYATAGHSKMTVSLEYFLLCLHKREVMSLHPRTPQLSSSSHE